MNQRRRVQLFDHWADQYDPSLEPDRNSFPFGGYDQVLDEIMRAAEAQRGMRVLDLGVGTGNLAHRFEVLGCDIWGIDFSTEMIARAARRLPRAVLVHADLLGRWPVGLEERFDRVVSAYVLHEFDLPTKVSLLKSLTERRLAAGGRIVIGDIAFPTAEAREAVRKLWARLWDDAEHYWAADEATMACRGAGLQIHYRQVSSCGGVFVFSPGRQGDEGCGSHVDSAEL